MNTVKDLLVQAGLCTLLKTYFTRDIQLSMLSTDPPEDVSTLFDTYDSMMRSLVDKHVPTKNVTNYSRPPSPWFNHRCQVAKTVTR